MNIYSITYYLKEETSSCGCNHEDHEDHHHEHHHRDDYAIVGNIKALGAWAHIMPTSFLVKTEKSSEEILDILKEFIEDQDILFVTSVNPDNVSSTITGAADWIKRESK